MPIATVCSFGRLFHAPVRYDAGMLKHLRIAVTALSLMACVLSIALWVRSYRYIDTTVLALWDTQVFQLGSSLGQLTVDSTNFDFDAAQMPKWRVISQPVAPIREGIEEHWETHGRPTLKFRRNQTGWIFFFRHWIVVLVLALLAAVSGFRSLNRFSLRALLIATTLVAVALGIIAAAM